VRMEPATGVPKGVCPLRGEHARGLAHSARVGERQTRTDEGARFNPRQLHQTSLARAVGYS